MNPFAFMVLCTAGWMKRNQQSVIEYLQEERAQRAVGQKAALQ
jgi:hypothetical protein